MSEQKLNSENLFSVPCKFPPIDGKPYTVPVRSEQGNEIIGEAIINADGTASIKLTDEAASKLKTLIKINSRKEISAGYVMDNDGIL